MLVDPVIVELLYLHTRRESGCIFPLPQPDVKSFFPSLRWCWSAFHVAVVRQVVVPLLDALTGKGIKRVTVAASFLALVGTGFLELGDAHASWNDLWCVAQAVGFGVAFTRIEVGAVFLFSSMPCAAAGSL